MMKWLAILFLCSVPDASFAASEGSMGIPQLETIYFDSDSVDILNADVIGKNAAWLKGHKSRVVILEGHCDERGDRDYNYSLGDRRARTVLKELIDEGVSPDQLIVMSRGKDRPTITARGETGWAKNRRVEFVVR